MSARRWKSEARLALRRAAHKVLAEPGGRLERNPDERPQLDSFDDWILFGPRMH